MRKRNARKNKLAALKRQSERDLVELIRRRLALPVERRMNFLRKRVTFRGSALYTLEGRDSLHLSQVSKRPSTVSPQS